MLISNMLHVIAQATAGILVLKILPLFSASKQHQHSQLQTVAFAH